MNKKQFIEVLKNPDHLNEQSLAGLKEIIEEYPFFQIGRMLWLKNLHKLDSIKYNGELKTGAACIADRTKLFHLINTIQGSSENINISEETETSAELSELPVEIVEPVKPLDTPSAIKGETLRTSTENYLNATDELSDENTNFYRSSSYYSPTLKTERTQGSMLFPAADLLDYEMTSSHSYSLPKVSELEVKPDDNRSFSDWLHIMHYSSPQKSEEKAEHKIKGMDLIDNFLNAKPEIIPNPDRKVKEIDLEQKSSTSQDEILSETLAKIYIKQGHKSKAISIFEKLRLKYPEKSVYFALRITELKEN